MTSTLSISGGSASSSPAFSASLAGILRQRCCDRSLEMRLPTGLVGEDVADRERGRAELEPEPGGIVERLRGLGLDTVQLEVVSANANARAIYARWGFEEQELTLATPLAALAERLGHLH
jgi:hypothetical protein